MAAATNQARFPAQPRSYPGAARLGFVFAAALGTVGAVLSTAPLQVIASALALALIIALLWRPQELPILILPPLFQWTEVALVPISTIWKAVPLNSLSGLGADLEASALFGLCAVVILAIGLRIGAGSTPQAWRRIDAEARSVSQRAVIRVAASLIVIGYLAAALSDVAGPARELLNVVSALKYAGIFIYGYWCLINGRGFASLALLALFEIVSGMTGFFAEFKNALLTLLVVGLTAHSGLRRKGVEAIAIAGSALLLVAIFWSAVKPDYRALVNAGSGEQVVLVPLDDRIAFLAQRAGAFSGEEFATGLDALIKRHGYIDFLAGTMKAVPATIPHEDGKLTQAAVAHVTMPRILFPDKPPLPSDTEIMARYTGQAMMWSSNTSISIGHLAELYVDFGYAGALAAILLIGLAVGWLCRSLLTYGRSPTLFSAGLVIMACLPLAYFGISYTKLVGALLFTAVITLVTQRLFGIEVAKALQRHSVRLGAVPATASRPG